MSRRSFLSAAGAAGVTAALAGCSGGSGGSNTTESTTESTTEQTTEQTTSSGGNADFPVTITQGQMPSTLDPHDHEETPTRIALMQAYEGLLFHDKDGKVIPSLATEWKRDSKGTVEFTLRDDATFHSGNKFTAKDAAFTINRIVKKDVGGLVSPQSSELAGVTGAEVASDTSIKVSSDGINPIVFAEFASYCKVMEKAWVDNHDEGYIATHINGTGPFVMDTYDESVRLVYKPNENYYKDTAAITKLTFNAAKETSVRVNQLTAGETDIIVNVSPQYISQLKSSDKASVSAAPSTRIIFNGMRYDVAPFSSKQFRQAMNYAIDLESIIKNVLQTFGSATAQPTLEGFFGYNSDLDIYPHDKAKAESLVEASGHAGAEITLESPVGRYLKDVEIAQAVVNQINSLSNVSCTLKQRDFGALAGELTDGDITTMPHFYLIGWGNATLDASQTIIPLLTTDGPVSSFSNDQLDSLIKQSQNEGDQGKRQKLLEQANKLCHDEAPWIFLNRQYSVYGASNRLKWTPRNDELISAYSIEQA